MSWIGYALLGGIYVGILFIYFTVPTLKDCIEMYGKLREEIESIRVRLDEISEHISRVETKLENIERDKQL